MTNEKKQPTWQSIYHGAARARISNFHWRFLPEWSGKSLIEGGM